MRDIKDLNIVVTGGAGFIGSHLTEKLLDLGAKVSVVDNLLHGSRIEHLQGNKNLIIHKVDIRDYVKILKIIEGKDIVFHLAAVTGVEETQAESSEVLDVEINGTVNVLKAAAFYNIKRFVFGSSSEVYGDSFETMKEEMSLSPKSTYAIAKLVGEEYCKAFYYDKRLLPFTILRYFNVYGSRQDERFVIPRIIKNILSNKTIHIYGDGEQTRDFTYIDDVVDMTIEAAFSNQTYLKTLNIGTGIPTTINELVYIIQKCINSNVEIMHVGYGSLRPHSIEVFNRVADTTKACKLLNCQPKVNLEDGIKKIIESLR